VNYIFEARLVFPTSFWKNFEITENISQLKYCEGFQNKLEMKLFISRDLSTSRREMRNRLNINVIYQVIFRK
jgi:hypothetical protein